MPANIIVRCPRTPASNRRRSLLNILALAAAGAASACDPDVPQQREASSLAQRHLIVDTHIDTPYRLLLKAADLGEAVPEREFDYPRARAGGLDVAFMSIYTPARTAADGDARELADRLIDDMEKLTLQHPAKFAIVTCSADVERLRGSDTVALALGMENGSPLAGRPGSLAHFVRRGIRYLGMAHSKSNEYADASYDLDERWQGLSPAGGELVDELNRRGVMVDLSHLSDKAAWQAIERSKTPVIASHSSLRHFIPGFHRNMSDDMVQAVAAQGGVVQINFGSGFVSPAARRWANRRDAALIAHTASEQADAAARSAFYETFLAANPYPFATLDTVLDHIDRAVELAGIDHVGLGSDFDGVGDTLPTGLKHVGDYPNLVVGLLERGYHEDQIQKILGGNLMRVWREVERYAYAQGHPPLCNVTQPMQKAIEETVANPAKRNS